MAELEGDLPETHALGDLLHGGSHPEQVRVIGAERNQVAQQLQQTPMPAARRQLCLLPFTGGRRVAPALPSPKAHRAGAGPSTDPGEAVGGPGTGREGDSWILAGGLIRFNTRTWRGKPISGTFAHCLPVLGGTNLLSAAEPRTES